MMETEKGLLLKMNPPLRPLPMPSLMMRRLLDGQIDWIETDHAPHTLVDKTRGYASGIPGLPYYPLFVKELARRGATKERLREITHDAVCRTFGMAIPAGGRAGEESLAREYEFDAWEALAQKR